MENELTNALGRLRYSATDLFNSGVGAAQNATSRAQKGIAGLVHGAADTLDNAGRKLRKTGTKAVAGVQDIGSRAVSAGENVGIERHQWRAHCRRGRYIGSRKRRGAGS